MKKLFHQSFKILIALFLTLSITIKVYAFDYTITFTATGAGTTIESIVVQNITQGTTVTLTAGNVLNLTDYTALNQVKANDQSLQIYPNPAQGKATVSFYASEGGNTQINVFGIDGKTLISKSVKLDAGLNRFRLSLPNGVFMLQTNENGLLHSSNVISQNNCNKPEIEFIGNEKINISSIQKAKSTIIPFKYNIGDLLLFKGISGNYTTILSDIITASKVINFNFVECKDVDGNYYSIVTIGNQVWMAENLKSSKYRNNIAITDKTNLSTWGTSTTEASSDYSTPNNSTTYGKLYNWYATTNANNLAPLGWHIPADADWTTLSDFLGGLNLAGNKLKEMGNLHWATVNTTTTNETGFTALPGGSRSTDNTVYDIGNIGYWWSLSEGSTTSNGWYRSLSNLNGTFTRGYYTKSGGMSVRCLMGDLPILTTTSSSSITSTGFISGGNINFDGNLPIISRGVCWSVSENPTLINDKTVDGSGIDVFTSNVTNLQTGTTYYVRAYATNSFGTGYGNQYTIKTLAVPTLTTITAQATSQTTATSGGNITDDGGTSVIARGVCWNTTGNPTTNDNKTNDGTGTGNFLSALTNLTVDVTYYIRAYANNIIGTSYGNMVTVTPRNFPTNGLVAWYPFNGNANDEGGNGNNGTVYGATLTTDRFGNNNSAYSFSNSYISCINNNIPTNSFSLSVWFYQNKSFENNEFICLGSASSTKWGAICSPLRTTMNYGAGCGGAGGNTINPTIPLNSWQHVVFVSQGTSLNCDIYINGKFIGTTSNGIVGGCSNNNLYFGVDIFSLPEYIDGKLDDIGIWNRALTQDEITTIYNYK
jgi:uncharacterized protein (TIGR02145 family)